MLIEKGECVGKVNLVLKLYDLEEFNPPVDYTLILDSSALTRVYKHRPCHLVFSALDLKILQLDPGNLPLVYINVHKEVHYLSTLMAIAKINHLPLLVYTTHLQYWSNLIQISGISPNKWGY